MTKKAEMARRGPPFRSGICYDGYKKIIALKYQVQKFRHRLLHFAVELPPA